MGKSKVGQIPEQAGCHPFQLGLCAAAVPPCPAPFPQHGRICLRLIRRRQDSQGRTSECSDARAAVVELNFLISSIPMRCQESGLLQYSLSHCPPSFHLIKVPGSIRKLWGSSYHCSNHVYFLLVRRFGCGIEQENYSLYILELEKEKLFLLLCLSHTHYFINQCIEQETFCWINIMGKLSSSWVRNDLLLWKCTRQWRSPSVMVGNQ